MKKTLYCKNCGEKLAPSSPFCRNCGERYIPDADGSDQKRRSERIVLYASVAAAALAVLTVLMLFLSGWFTARDVMFIKCARNEFLSRESNAAGALSDIARTLISREPSKETRSGSISVSMDLEEPKVSSFDITKGGFSTNVAATDAIKTFSERIPDGMAFSAGYSVYADSSQLLLSGELLLKGTPLVGALGSFDERYIGYYAPALNGDYLVASRNSVEALLNEKETSLSNGVMAFGDAAAIPESLLEAVLSSVSRSNTERRFGSVSQGVTREVARCTSLTFTPTNDDIEQIMNEARSVLANGAEDADDLLALAGSILGFDITDTGKLLSDEGLWSTILDGAESAGLVFTINTKLGSVISWSVKGEIAGKRLEIASEHRLTDSGYTLGFVSRFGDVMLRCEVFGRKDGKNVVMDGDTELSGRFVRVSCDISFTGDSSDIDIVSIVNGETRDLPIGIYNAVIDAELLGGYYFDGGGALSLTVSEETPGSVVYSALLDAPDVGFFSADRISFELIHQTAAELSLPPVQPKLIDADRNELEDILNEMQNEYRELTYDIFGN